MDLNADLGEGFPWDASLLDRVTSANVCCGAHAGTIEEISSTLRGAVARNVAIGAHPGYPDRATFGRVPRTTTAEEVRALVLGQVESLAQLARTCGASIRYLKPHGALYNQGQVEPEVAAGMVQAARAWNLPVYGQPGGAVEDRAKEAGLLFIAEGFPDRRYRPDGSLVPRSQPDAILREPADIARQVQSLLESARVQTLCIHGDDPQAVLLADLVRQVLAQLGVPLAPAIPV